MTLMFALFVVLFASSHHDKQTIQRVSIAMRNGCQEMGTFSGNTAAAQPTTQPMSKTGIGPDTPQAATAKPDANTVNAGIDLVELQQKLNRALGKEIERQEVNMRMTPEGFVIRLHELGFFDSGEARLMPGASDKIKRIAAVLMQYGLDMRVEGHSDNVPIHNAAFSSNWDLSTARAMAVAMMLVNESGVD